MNMCIDRRSLLRQAVLLPVAIGATSRAALAGPAEHGRKIPVPGAELWCTDTGGDGDAIVLLHPATGSARSWEHQIPTLKAAGFRVLAYSRRGHEGSSAIDPAHPGTAAGDLAALVDALGLDRCHLVGSAAGAFTVIDYAMLHPGRLISATVASSFGGFTDPDYRATLDRLLPREFHSLPATFRELGPEYRAADPAGVKRWEAIERTARHGPDIRQPRAGTADWASVARIRTPMLMMTGGADLYAPPALMGQAARHIPNCEVQFVADAGHALFWEKPEAFNGILLDFLRRHSR
ncbi:alpha/beta fold hydrolase [Pacificimonas sp. ICDLI1SI03]